MVHYIESPLDRIVDVHFGGSGWNPGTLGVSPQGGTVGLSSVLSLNDKAELVGTALFSFGAGVHVISVNAHATGKYFFEFEVGPAWVVTGEIFGFMTGTSFIYVNDFPVNIRGSVFCNFTQVIVIDNDGNIVQRHDVPVGGFHTGEIAPIAIDIDARTLVWGVTTIPIDVLDPPFWLFAKICGFFDQAPQNWIRVTFEGNDLIATPPLGYTGGW